MTFTVTLSKVAAVATKVSYSTANNSAQNGTDYTGVYGTLTFNAGQTSQTFTVSIKGDSVHEGDETFLVDLLNPTNASRADAQAIGTIVDNE